MTTAQGACHARSERARSVTARNGICSRNVWLPTAYMNESYPPLRPILELLRDPVFVLGTEGRWLYSNAAFSRLVGYSAQDLCAKGPPFPFWPSAEAHESQALLERVVSEGHAGGQDALVLGLLDTHGRRATALFHWAELYGASGEPLACYFVLGVTEPETSALEKLLSQLEPYEEQLRMLSNQLSGWNRRSTPAPEHPLSGVGDLSVRESEVLRTFVDGADVRATANALNISHHTVRNHLKAIFRKLGVHSQRELLAGVRGGSPVRRKQK